MITLGIETSCDETSAAVLKGPRKLLSNVTRSSLLAHRAYGGVVPEIASRAHLGALLPCVAEALEKAGISLKKIGLIAVTRGPGLMGSLLVGIAAAKTLSLALKKPIVGVDHVIAHLYGATLGRQAPDLPFLGLVVSGGHTLLLKVEASDRVVRLGGTIDDAAGEAFDKAAKIMGLGYPGGPHIERLARGCRTSGERFSRPYLSSGNDDFSFSGIKTAVLYRVQALQKKGLLSVRAKREIALGFEQAVCETIARKTVAAAVRNGLRQIVAGGGVVVNRSLREHLTREAVAAGLKVVFPVPELCQDNAGMVACLGRSLYDRGLRHTLDFEVYPDFKKYFSLNRPV